MALPFPSVVIRFREPAAARWLDPAERFESAFFAGALAEAFAAFAGAFGSAFLAGAFAAEAAFVVPFFGSDFFGDAAFVRFFSWASAFVSAARLRVVDVATLSSSFRRPPWPAP
jgi:hypothetical protein